MSPKLRKFSHAFDVGLLILWSVAGLFLVVAGAVSDPDGIFGSNTAAWVQGVGSIAAIVAAIIIDQGAARRLRQQQSEEVAARHDAIVMAIAHCRTSTAAAAQEANVLSLEGVYQGAISAATYRSVKAAWSALHYHLSQNGAINARLLAALTLTKERMDEAVTALEAGRSVRSTEEKMTLLFAMNGASTDIGEIVEQYAAQ
jgi:hypothetical protein